MSQNTDQLLRKILTDVLGLKPGQADTFTAGTGLFGDLPELDSMAVAGLLTEMEDRLDIVIEDDEIGVDQAVGELARLAGGLLGLEQVHELDGREEPHSQVVVHDGLHADGGREMRLAGAGAADQHDVVRLLDEVAAVQ